MTEFIMYLSLVILISTTTFFIVDIFNKTKTTKEIERLKGVCRMSIKQRQKDLNTLGGEIMNNKQFIVMQKQEIAELERKHRNATKATQKLKNQNLQLENKTRTQTPYEYSMERVLNGNNEEKLKQTIVTMEANHRQTHMFYKNEIEILKEDNKRIDILKANNERLMNSNRQLKLNAKVNENVNLKAITNETIKLKQENKQLKELNTLLQETNCELKEKQERVTRILAGVYL